MSQTELERLNLQSYGLLLIIQVFSNLNLRWRSADSWAGGIEENEEKTSS